ncbi:hypothetical protein EBR77_00210 [bacterium]|nr:hypothetical protein [bacterium]NBX78608.1 hypothetical protein [bacterium]
MKFNIFVALQDALKIYIRHFMMIAVSLLACGLVQYVLYLFLYQQAFHAIIVHRVVDAQLLIPFLKICAYFVLSYIQLTMVYTFLWQYVHSKIQRSFIYFDLASYHVSLQSFFSFFVLFIVKELSLKSYLYVQYLYRYFLEAPVDIFKISSMGFFTLLSLLCMYLSVRYVFAFPLICLKQYSLSKAIKYSMYCSSNFDVVQLLLITAISFVALASLKIPVFGILIALSIGVLFELVLFKQCEHNYKG